MRNIFEDEGMSSDPPAKTQHCSFCGIEQGRDTPLIAGIEGQICEACVRLAEQVVANWGRKRSMAELHGNVPKPEDIKRHLDQYVIGQELAKEILSVAVYNHYKRLRHESREILGLAGSDTEVQVGKSNILMIGPTGTGKTLLASTLARIVGVPFVVADATTLTQAGYVGDDVENILVRLLEAADGSVERAEWGIVYIDEVDKLAKSPEMAINTRDISGEGVQQALLRFVEGSQVKVAARGRRREGSGGGEEVTIDTRNILFIAGGAFPGLERHVEKRIGPPRGEIGFHAPVQDAKRPLLEELLAEIQPEDLRRFGLIPEFIGRFPVIAPLEPLDEAAFVRILTEPRDALVRQYQKLFAYEGVELVFTEPAIRRIAARTIERDTGARGLRSIIEHILRRPMFEIPSQSDVRQCVVDADTVDGKAPVTLVRAEEEAGGARLAAGEV
ncbi:MULTISPECIES: ATP-dependent Clp protease ATP-binding subunit ClpX [Methylococcus]|jgi:ATP-dependent Clp protease ATP-binding subunit ClpX|nr:ATP-dependent Clp protease ATP-binding subunit ClpX [Methylococcus capsulatus]AAU92118.1 ATP-dependent Clp protease, ATP-binding subunit ClpX [Methylococcus capsulatus str. Bath]QXP87523.1 ATP-dependent Clp protease ATP-binding subunit ClpX [Methylococcus capsulatus]QXP92737.1 ATP-dependent Clp protease ATP-binding subunit ClpX [Methylococcus capsulatus]UQN12534.1 ATP-dependent Clp protease ATP-binding subunit ClpX [Methylococcus capsulatus]CAI8867238.1 ATP-dependent Clp protease ATP-bindin